MNTLLGIAREDKVAPLFVFGTRIAQARSRTREAFLTKQPKRILVVDDDPDIRQMLLDRMTSYGYVVETAVNGREALDALRHGGFDGMLLDIRMPEVDGLEVLRLLQASHSTMPVVLITASTSRARATQAIAEGARAYLLKPFNSAKLKDVLDQHFRLSE